MKKRKAANSSQTNPCGYCQIPKDSRDEQVNLERRANIYIPKIGIKEVEEFYGSGDEKSDLENECSKEGDARSKSADSKAPEPIFNLDKYILETVIFQERKKLIEEFVEKLKAIRWRDDCLNGYYDTNDIENLIKEYEAKL